MQLQHFYDQPQKKQLQHLYDQKYNCNTFMMKTQSQNMCDQK